MGYTQKGVNAPGPAGTRIDNITTDAGVAGGAGTGLKYSNDGHVMFALVNTAANTPNVVIEGGILRGQSVDDITIAMPANGVKIVGPYPPDLYSQGGFIQMNFTGGNETDMAVYAFAEGGA